MPKFPPKPPAPSVRTTLGAALARSRNLSTDTRPQTRAELVEEIIAKLDLPASVEAQLRGRSRRDN